jgi:hypothetical protein
MRHIIMSSLTATGVLAGLLFTGVGVAAAAEPVLPELDGPLSVEDEIDLTAEEIDGLTGNIKFVGEVIGTAR